MHLDHDSAHSLGELVGLVNGDGGRGAPDVLASVEALDGFLDAQGISGDRVAGEAGLRAARRLRARLRAIFDAASAGEAATAVAGINALLADAGATPHLVEHGGLPLHVHYTPPDAPVHHRLGAEMAMSLAIVVREDGGRVERLRVCESPDCDRVLVDLSRNRSRRYCDAQCANRQHVAAYRQRSRGRAPS